MTTQELIALRDDIRRECFPDGGGGCSIVAECIAKEYGHHEDGGCYVTVDGRHIAHLWNVLPGGLILDATADQFQEGDNVRVTSGNDPRYMRYCPCGGRDG